MENEGLVRFVDDAGVVIEKPGDATDAQRARSRHGFSMEPFVEEAALQRATVLGCVLGLFVAGVIGLVLFAGVRALITGHVF